MWFSSKVLSLLEACFDFTLGSSLSMNIKIMGGKITKNLGFKSLLPKVKNFLLSWNEQVTFYKFILFHLWFDTVFLKILINENEGVTLSCLFCQAGILEITSIVYVQRNFYKYETWYLQMTWHSFSLFSALVNSNISTWSQTVLITYLRIYYTKTCTKNYWMSDCHITSYE